MRGTKPIDTAPTAAVPIMVKTTRRERFMGSPVAAQLNSFGESQVLIFKLWHSSFALRQTCG
jgi:hypothetical protein